MKLLRFVIVHLERNQDGPVYSPVETIIPKQTDKVEMDVLCKPCGSKVNVTYRPVFPFIMFHLNRGDLLPLLLWYLLFSPLAFPFFANLIYFIIEFDEFRFIEENFALFVFYLIIPFMGYCLSASTRKKRFSLSSTIYTQANQVKHKLVSPRFKEWMTGQYDQHLLFPENDV